eukprot:TRINITY_DN17604_c0_g4_i1.p1 TRINITY_DN17604_c0_g4~~TRINITY_DN17604_c0_g4_i1.p1  ORF type:complete len:272 (+),score=58.13 TRINITY_DN17604_c0_g4_i1:63-878(+)
MKKTLVIVTGASRGLGKAICDKLDSVDGMVVVRGVRKAPEGDGEWEMDVTDDESVGRAVEGLREKVRDVEDVVLVNNAGVGDDIEWNLKGAKACEEVARKVIAVNVEGVVRVTEAFLPLLLSAPGKARIVNISSGASQGNLEKSSPAMQSTLRGPLPPTHLASHITAFLAEYTAAETVPSLSPSGYWLQAYGFSKALLNAYTQHLAASHPSISAHACTPGFVLTDMTSGYKGDSKLKTPEDGAVTPCFLILGNADSEPSSYWRDGPAKGEW